MTNAMAPIIEVQDLSKRFGEVVAVDRIAFQVLPGEIFGFLGPNGAGKTTTINMLTGLTRPTEGRISFLGRDYTAEVKKAQHLMGIVPDESNLYPELSGYENLVFCAALYGLSKQERKARAKDLLREFGLMDAAARSFAQYSKGMKRKLTIAAGIIHRPQILFLDEPTTGLDVASARHIRQLIKQLNRSGCTVFLTTHYLEEAERLGDRLAFIVQGRVVRIDSLANLMRDFEGRKIIQFAFSAPADLLVPFHRCFPFLTGETVGETGLRVYSDRTIDLIPLIQFFQEHQVEVIEARGVKPSLEDVFVRVTGLETEIMKREKGGQGK
ncbi:MAG: ABC transporter ATP-binding protein [Thermodesulfobacteriota bacterium]